MDAHEMALLAVVLTTGANLLVFIRSTHEIIDRLCHPVPYFLLRLAL